MIQNPKNSILATLQCVNQASYRWVFYADDSSGRCIFLSHFYWCFAIVVSKYPTPIQSLSSLKILSAHPNELERQVSHNWIPLIATTFDLSLSLSKVAMYEFILSSILRLFVIFAHMISPPASPQNTWELIVASIRALLTRLKSSVKSRWIDKLGKSWKSVGEGISQYIVYIYNPLLFSILLSLTNFLI